MATSAEIPVCYHCPITTGDLRRLLRGQARIHLTVRRQPPHISLVLTPRGRHHWPTSWPSYTCRVFLEPP